MADVQTTKRRRAPPGETTFTTHLPFGSLALLDRFAKIGIAGTDRSAAARHILIGALTSKDYAWLREECN